jgi:hypothetical protein
MIRASLITLVLLTGASGAWAGAWTLASGKYAAFTGTTISTASRRFDSGGAPSEHVVFNKMTFQNWMEYGLTDSVTVLAVPAYVFAETGTDKRKVTQMGSGSIEAGMRLRLWSKYSVLSIQASAKTAGAFDMATSSSGEAGRQLEARLLFGRSFKLLKLDGYLDFEMARRWIARPRPDEFAVEGSLGLNVTSDDLLLFQNFTFFTVGDARAPYESYALSKLQLSLVHRLSSRWSVQSGYFCSLGGRNIVKERGLVGTIWFKA